MMWTFDVTGTGRGLPPWSEVAKGSLMILVAGALSLGDGTASSHVTSSDVRRASRAGWTSSGVVERPRVVAVRRNEQLAAPAVDAIGSSPGEETAKLVLELRSRSGLTWDQMASVFGVDRRSVHFWASGRAMNSVNAERLGRALAAVARIDQGDPTATRALLITPRADGRVPLDMLREGRFEELADAAVEPRALQKKAPRIARSAADSRTPRSPAELLGAKQDSLGTPAGKLIATKRLTPKKPV
jgi:transcriptional regulator with XRE-family HTH domain